MIEVDLAVHLVGITERTAVALGIVLRAVAAREHEPEATRLLPEQLVDAVDHAGRRVAQQEQDRSMIAAYPRRRTRRARVSTWLV